MPETIARKVSQDPTKGSREAAWDVARTDASSSWQLGAKQMYVQ